jgi:hypothetical protein
MMTIDYIDLMICTSMLLNNHRLIPVQLNFENCYQLERFCTALKHSRNAI